jgi:uroporphyrinogen-III synthase
MGAEVDFVPVYDVIMPDRNEVIVPINKINKEKFDMFMFTSPSAYNNFICLMDIGKPHEYFSQANIAAIGPTTQSAILKSGVAVDVVPEIYTIEKMIEGVINFYERNT